MDWQRNQLKYKQSKPSMLGRGIERLTHPFGKALASVVPKPLVEAVLKGLDGAVGAKQLGTFTHDTNDLQAAHDAATGLIRTARAISASTGAAAGLGGAISMGADIPATIAIALRTIRDTGRAYGFSGEGPSEKLFRLQILELAALDDPDQRAERIAALEAGIGGDGDLINAGQEHITPVVDQAVERISRAIAFATMRSRAGMLVPIAGSVVGGIVNSSFQNDVGKAARFAFLARRLKEAGPSAA